MRRLAASTLLVAVVGVAPTLATQEATPPPAQAPGLQAVARNLVRAALVDVGDKVLITGSVRDVALMEHIAIETRKAGGQYLIALNSEQLARRSYDEVPEAYDTMPPTLSLAMVNTFDAQIAIDVGETEGLFAHVPQARRAARAKAAEPVNQAFRSRGIRFVNLGNNLYPTATLARRLGVAEPDLATVFWKAASVPAESLRGMGEAVRAVFATAQRVTLTHPNGTNLTFGVDASRAFVSDGALTPDAVSKSTWLPAGEFIVPAAAGTAEGTLVIDRMLWDGREVLGLTLTYGGGRLTSMTARTDITGLKARYDLAGGGKDQFAWLDIGLNPAVTLPTGTGSIVWTARGGVTVGLGDNRAFGGTNASDFSLFTAVAGASVAVDGRIVVENGMLK